MGVANYESLKDLVLLTKSLDKNFRVHEHKTCVCLLYDEWRADFYIFYFLFYFPFLIVQ